MGGIGVALLGTGAVFWGVGSAERSNLREECASAASCTQSDIDAAKTKLVVGDVVAGVGVLAVAAGLWFALRNSTSVERFGARTSECGVEHLLAAAWSRGRLLSVLRTVIR